MIKLLLFMFPAGLSLKVKEEYFGEEKNIKDAVLTFIKYALIINLLMFAILYFYSKDNWVNLEYSLESVSFIFKYLLLSFIIAIVVPVADEYIRKYIKINFNIKVREKRNVKKNR